MSRLHPAGIALGVVAVVALIGLSWVASSLQDLQRDVNWSGQTPPPEVVHGWALLNFSYSIAMPALSTAAAASVLGLVLVWCLSPDRQSVSRSTRTMRAAGSTENRTAVTTPNSSPSISKS